MKLLHEVKSEEINQLKQQPGKDIAVFGSSDLCVSLLKQNLLDEVRLLINPVVLTKGKRLFQGLDQKLDFRLLKTRTFQNGNVLHYYQPQK